MPDDAYKLADEPVVQPPAVTKSPPTGRKFPCPSCGAKLDFDPTSRGLACPYCGYKQQIQRLADATVAERDYQDYLTREEGKGQVIPGRASETRCTGCGAVVLLDDKLATEKCPFCATHLEHSPAAARAMIPPEAVLPFGIDLRKARDKFDAWLGSLWFAPSELKKVAALGQLQGVYLPHWTYDSMTYTFYDGSRGDDYTTTEWYTVTDDKGNSRQESRTVVHTNWTPVSGEVQHFFDDVLVCGSRSIPPALLDDLGDWALPKLEPFQPDYLSGFQTERYAIGLKDGFATAKELMQPTIHRLICEDIGGDHQTVSGKKTRYSAVTFKHVLLPVWVAAYRYQGAAYQILVNGRTGKVTGRRPWSVTKIAALAAAVSVGIFFLVLLVMKLKH